MTGSGKRVSRAQAEQERMLALLEIMLPYEFPKDLGEFQRRYLAEALKIKGEYLLYGGIPQSSPPSRSISVAGELTPRRPSDPLVRYVDAVLANVLGGFEEFQLSYPPPSSSSAPFHEPAWDDIIYPALITLTRLYVDAPLDSSLFVALHRPEYLDRLTLLMASPDEREQGAIVGILVLSGSRMLRICQQQRLSEVGTWALKNILRVLGPWAQNVLQHPSDWNVKALPSALDTLRRLLEQAVGTFFQRDLLALTREAVGLIGKKGYPAYKASLLALITTALEAARAHEAAGPWLGLSNAILEACFHRNNEHAYDAQVVQLTLELILDRRLAPLTHVGWANALGPYLLRHRDWHGWLMVISILDDDNLIGALRQWEEDALYQDRDLQIKVLRGLLIGLTRWYLEVNKAQQTTTITTPADSGAAMERLKAFLNKLYKTYREPHGRSLLRIDSELDTLWRQFQRAQRPLRVEPIVLPPTLLLSSSTGGTGAEDEGEGEEVSLRRGMPNSVPRMTTGSGPAALTSPTPRGHQSDRSHGLLSPRVHFSGSSSSRTSRLSRRDSSGEPISPGSRLQRAVTAPFSKLFSSTSSTLRPRRRRRSDSKDSDSSLEESERDRSGGGPDRHKDENSRSH